MIYNGDWSMDVIIKHGKEKKKYSFKNCHDITINQDLEEQLYTASGTIIAEQITTITLRKSAEIKIQK